MNKLLKNLEKEELTQTMGGIWIETISNGEIVRLWIDYGEEDACLHH